MIAPPHPLFREVAACAFDAHERRALDVLIGRPIFGNLELALLSSASNGWVEAIRRLAEHATDCGMKLNFDMALRYAARQGQIAAMCEAIESGAKDVNYALVVASAHGQQAVMQEMKDLGATDVDSALLNAAARGQLGAMRLARKWGAANLDAAMNAAMAQRQFAAVGLLRSWEGEISIW